MDQNRFEAILNQPMTDEVQTITKMVALDSRVEVHDYIYYTDQLFEPSTDPSSYFDDIGLLTRFMNVAMDLAISNAVLG